MLEMLRVIREQEPSKPSIKLSSSDALPTLSANRGTEPAKLTNLVRGELDWIVMKALEKDRARRYETASGFAADVQHYLADEPVSACPPSAAYNIRKFVRRNRAAVLTAAVVVVALLGGTTIATWQAVRAKRAEARSRIAEERAQRWLRETQLVVDRYLSVIRDNDELRAKGREPLLEKLLEPAREIYEKLVLQEESDEPGVQAERARIYGLLGKVYHAAGRHAKSEETYRKAQSIMAELVAAHPDDVQYQNDLAVTWNNLGNCLNDDNQFEKAQETYAQAASLYRQLLEAHPNESKLFDFPRELAECLYNRADLHFRHGDLGNAEQLYGQALKPVKNRDADSTPETLNVLGRIYTGLGGVYERTGRKEQAGEVFQKALSVREQLTRRRPSVPEYQRNLALSSYNLGTWFQNDNRWEEARDAYRSALGPLQFLVREYPSVPEYQVDLARIHNNVGIVWTRSAPTVKDAADFAEAEKFYVEAEKAYLEAMRIRRELVRANPNGPEYPQKLADSLRNLGIVYFVRTQGLIQLGRTGDALPNWERFLVEVKELPESGAIKGETLFGLANHVAWPIKFVGDDEARKEAFAEQSLRLLKRARVAGYFNDPAGRQQLQEHPRLDRLRQRPDFQQILDEVRDNEKQLEDR